MKKRIMATVLALVLASSALTACGKNDSENAESTNPTVIETVTDEQGEAVTDASGEAVTEVYEEIPVVDDKGNVVKDENGKTVTKKVPATTSKDKDNSRPWNSGGSVTKPNKDNTTITTKPEDKGTTTKPEKPTEKPIKPTEKPTEKPTTPPTKPTDPPTKPTDLPTKPTEPPTEKPTERSEDIDYFVQYAINYGKSIGLKYDPNGDKDDPNYGWDMPTIITAPVVGNYKISYKEKEIRDALNLMKREGSISFWVQASNEDFDGNPMSGGKHYLYIGR